MLWLPLCLADAAGRGGPARKLAQPPLWAAGIYMTTCENSGPWNSSTGWRQIFVQLYKEGCYEMCGWPVVSPRVLHCGPGQEEISFGLARDSQGLCGIEHVFISVPTWRVAKEGICLHDFQEQLECDPPPPYSFSLKNTLVLSSVNSGILKAMLYPLNLNQF